MKNIRTDLDKLSYYKYCGKAINIAAGILTSVNVMKRIKSNTEKIFCKM